MIFEHLDLLMRNVLGSVFAATYLLSCLIARLDPVRVCARIRWRFPVLGRAAGRPLMWRRRCRCDAGKKGNGIRLLPKGRR